MRKTKIENRKERMTMLFCISYLACVICLQLWIFASTYSDPLGMIFRNYFAYVGMAFYGIACYCLFYIKRKSG